MTLLEIYWAFFKFGLLCFGGGYMLVPLLSAELVGTGPNDPLTPEAFANLVSIAQGHAGADRDQYGDLCRLHAAGDPGGLPRARSGL